MCVIREILSTTPRSWFSTAFSIKLKTRVVPKATEPAAATPLTSTVTLFLEYYFGKGIVRVRWSKGTAMSLELLKYEVSIIVTSIESFGPDIAETNSGWSKTNEISVSFVLTHSICHLKLPTMAGSIYSTLLP